MIKPVDSSLQYAYQFGLTSPAQDRNAAQQAGTQPKPAVAGAEKANQDDAIGFKECKT
jgi:hypothetical protein